MNAHGYKPETRKANRRNFLGKLLLGGASFSILPGAGRIWKAFRETAGEVDPTFTCPMAFPYAFVLNLTEKEGEISFDAFDPTDEPKLVIHYSRHFTNELLAQTPSNPE